MSLNPYFVIYIENRIAKRVKLAVTSDSKVCATNSKRVFKAIFSLPNVIL